MTASLNFRENYSLQSFNTLGLASVARYYTEIHTLGELISAIAFANRQGLPLIPLGGGSNVVLGRTLEAVVVRIHLLGCRVVHRKNGVVQVRVGAGENWHDLVQWTLACGAFGLENLSLIPGSVGAAPIQNIGAYGVELKDYFVALEAVNVVSGEVEYFDREACGFGYRDSVFKQEKLDQYIIIWTTDAWGRWWLNEFGDARSQRLKSAKRCVTFVGKSFQTHGCWVMPAVFLKTRRFLL